MRFIFFLYILFFGLIDVQAQNYVLAQPHAGEGLLALLRRFELPDNRYYQDQFVVLNTGRVDARSKSLLLNTSYRMPIQKFEYNGKSIRSTLGFNDYAHAKKIQEYNERVFSAGQKKNIYTRDRELWVPLHLLPTNPQPHDENESAGSFSIFGPEHSRVEIQDRQLAGKVFYLISGHGGPDPGAVGKRGSNLLCEDEYAYDITLRLAKRLLEHDARVYLIVRDPNDGIREEKILKPDRDEVYYGNKPISADPITRLRDRARIVNSLYRQNGGARTSQYAIILHVDSRANSKRIDIFYYYQRNSKASKALAKKLYSVIKRKYDLAQPGRGYRGHVETRNLYMLRNVEPTTVYIELGNIKNSRDQDRFIIANNRQAVANWLCDGILEYHR